jgi:hypothetical protein
MYELLYILLKIKIFMWMMIYLDKLVVFFKYKNPYYFVHFVTNSLIVYITIGDVISLYYNFQQNKYNECDLDSVWLITSLHIYHLIYHSKKINVQDLIHHIPTLFAQCIIPLTTGYNNILISHITFYLCGLPGGIDYLLLFLVRNNKLDKMTEKRVNKFLNMWIRCPGTIMSAAFVITEIPSLNDYLQLLCAILTFIFSYWNGIYYNERVITDYAIQNYNNKIMKI